MVPPKAPTCSPYRVDVDPLVVIGGVGEGVDPLLCDLHPVGHSDLLANHRLESVEHFHMRILAEAPVSPSL